MSQFTKWWRKYAKDEVLKHQDEIVRAIELSLAIPLPADLCHQIVTKAVDEVVKFIFE